MAFETRIPFQDNNPRTWYSKNKMQLIDKWWLEINRRRQNVPLTCTEWRLKEEIKLRKDQHWLALVLNEVHDYFSGKILF